MTPSAAGMESTFSFTLHDFNRTKKMMTSLTSTAKVVDLQSDVQDPRKCQGLTTDFGVKISDTDNR